MNACTASYLEPACIPRSDEDEWEDEDVEELDEEDIWSDVSGSIIYDRIYADSFAILLII